MRLAPVLVVSAAALAALAAAPLLVPGTAERLAMFARDGKSRSASQTALDALRAGESDPRVLAALFHIDRREGDPDEARQAVLAYLRQRPDDAGMLAEAAAFFEADGDRPRLLQTLEALVTLRGSAADTERLAGLYRLDGRVRDETRVLLSAALASIGNAARLRLAQLLLADAKPAEAAAVLDGAIAPAGPEGESLRGARFEALLRAGHASRAVDEAALAVAAGLTQSEQAAMVQTLAFAGAGDEAVRLASLARPDGAAPTAFAWSLGQLGRFDLARAVLAKELVAEPRPARHAAAGLLVDLALASGQTGALLAEIARLATTAEPRAHRAASALAASLFARQGYGALAPIRPYLAPTLLEDEPLFAAELLRAEGHSHGARAFLALCDLPSLDVAELSRWRVAAAALLTPAAYADLLAARWKERRLPASLIADLQAAARRAGQFDPAWRVLQGAPSPQTKEAKS